MPQGTKKQQQNKSTESEPFAPAGSAPREDIIYTPPQKAFDSRFDEPYTAFKHSEQAKEPKPENTAVVSAAQAAEAAVQLIERELRRSDRLLTL